MMTERENKLLRQALIGPSGKSLTENHAPYTFDFVPPETQSEIAEFDQLKAEEQRKTLFDELSDITPREHWLN